MTDATTRAMVRGEASTRPWPMNDAACSTTSSVGGTDPRKPVKGRSSFSPMPSDWAAAVEVVLADLLVLADEGRVARVGEGGLQRDVAELSSG